MSPLGREEVEKRGRKRGRKKADNAAGKEAGKDGCGCLVSPLGRG